MQPEIQLDPVTAYDQIAPQFVQLSEQRRTYLTAIEKLVISQIPRGASSLLDIGSGDGKRAFRIAQASGLKTIVLLEPSAEMRAQWPAGTQGWAIPAEELRHKDEVFDVITCLWNVLGHISPAATRLQVLRECARLLSPEGVLLIDVNHRYNARHYGLLPTLRRILYDLVRPNARNGDVTVRWNVNGTSYATGGHVFTHREFESLAHSAGFQIARKFTVDYRTGHIRRSKFSGHPLYVLQRLP